MLRRSFEWWIWLLFGGTLSCIMESSFIHYVGWKSFQTSWFPRISPPPRFWTTLSKALECAIMNAWLRRVVGTRMFRRSIDRSNWDRLVYLSRVGSWQETLYAYTNVWGIFTVSTKPPLILLLFPLLVAHHYVLWPLWLEHLPIQGFLRDSAWGITHCSINHLKALASVAMED